MSAELAFCWTVLTFVDTPFLESHVGTPWGKNLPHPLSPVPTKIRSKFQLLSLYSRGRPFQRCICQSRILCPSRRNRRGNPVPGDVALLRGMDGILTQFLYIRNSLGVAETKDANRDLTRLYVDLKSALQGCPAATIWNHSELDVHSQNNWLFGNGLRVLWVARHLGTAFDTIGLDTSLLNAPRDCPAATVWNHLELDVRVQNLWLFANGSDILWAARHCSTACNHILLSFSVLGALLSCTAWPQFGTTWNLMCICKVPGFLHMDLVFYGLPDLATLLATLHALIDINACTMSTS